MRLDAYVLPGQGASDALMDWFEAHEVVPVVHDVRREDELAEALALGAGVLPVIRKGDRVVPGFVPDLVAELVSGAKLLRNGLSVAIDESGLPVVAEVSPGSAAAAAGLLPGDVITQLGGYTAFSIEQLEQALSLRGSRIRLRVRRGQELVALNLPSEMAA